MPATEWMEKYEAIKAKLTCKTDLDAYFTEKVIGNRAVDILDIGTVHFPTGTVFACDPMIELEDTPPFLQTVPAGTYPAKICVVPSEKYGDRYACVKIVVSNEKPVRYELGMVGNENLDEELGEDENTSASVWMPVWDVLWTSGPGKPSGNTGPGGWRRIRPSTLTTICSVTCWMKMQNPTPNIRERVVTGSTGRCLIRTAAFPSSLLAGGTGIILSTSVMMNMGRSAACMCTSSTLKPAMKNRSKRGKIYGMAETGADGRLGSRFPYERLSGDGCISCFREMTEWEKYASEAGFEDDQIALRPLGMSYSPEGTCSRESFVDAEQITRNKLYIYTKEENTGFEHHFLMKRVGNSRKIDGVQMRLNGWQRVGL